MPSTVAYPTSHFAADIGNYYYGPGHPMKPHRLKLTHHLIKCYGLYRKMECYVSVCYDACYWLVLSLFVLCPVQRPRMATAEELSRFHSDDYVDFLRRVTPENCKALSSQMQKCEFAKGSLWFSASLPAYDF
jgi:histone deacetylase 1/2